MLTVKKAYDELELLGYLETQRGRGTFVCARLPQADPAQQREQVGEAARANYSRRPILRASPIPTFCEILEQADRALQSTPVEKVVLMIPVLWSSVKSRVPSNCGVPVLNGVTFRHAGGRSRWTCLGETTVAGKTTLIRIAMGML